MAVFGGISSPVALSELGIIHDKKIIYLDPWAAATPIVENGRSPNFVFRVSVRDEYAAGFLLPEALKVSDKVGLLLVNNGWGRSNHRALIDELKQRSLEAVSIQWFDWGETSHQNMINALYQDGAEVIIYVGNSVEAVSFIRQLAVKQPPVPVVSHWGITGGDFELLTGDVLHKVDLRVLQTFSFINNKDKRAKTIVDRYREKYQVNSAYDIVAPTGMAHAYDLTHLLVLAIRKANGVLSIVANGVVDNDVKKRTDLLKSALSNSERLKLLINDLLDVQKVSSGNIDLHLNTVASGSMIDDVIKRQEGYASQFGVTIIHSNDGEEALFMEVDEHRIQQVFDNLISNAIKFSPAKGVVEIASCRVDDEIKISIRDYGEGVPKGFQHKICTRFSQADGSSCRKVAGTGLGLNICKWIVEAHDGSIGYENAPDGGALFWFKIPMINKVTPQMPNSDSAAQSV